MALTTARPGASCPPPELDPVVVERWRASGGQLVELLTEVRALGGVGAVRLGPAPTVLVTGPQAVQHVLAQHPDRYVKRSHRARRLVGDSVLATSGEPWRRQRKLLQAQFTGIGMRRYEQRIADAARRTVERWTAYERTGQAVDLGEELRFFALDTIWRSLTGHPLEDHDYRELAVLDAVVAALPTLPPEPAERPDPAVAAARAAVDADLARIDAVSRRAIAAARRGEPGPDGPGLLHLLVDGAASRPEYDEQLIRDELVGLLTAGHETTAKSLAWLHLLLDRHPEYRDWALDAGEAGSAARREAVQALISETLRLYPAAWLLPRFAAEADTLAGYRIEADTEILTSPYLTHRDPALWPDPDRFDPTRFTAPGRRPTQPGAYYPFGIGARACLGLQFALREMTALLELLLPAFTPVFTAAAPAPAFGFILRPDGPLTATITRRS
ncbi:cytochrome P450 [Kitasatospora sp. NBC_01266]|uniref:cytochrome P450 n=1 Tax=Kitasatospora sp. NBC_01266 TaxID=2903572 RepID=UPI002E34C423|nr:cytochrome P450 [Kitasatospora sp. NBC_01266]